MNQQTISLGDLIAALYDAAAGESSEQSAATCLAALSTFDILLRNEAARELEGQNSGMSPLFMCLSTP
ncbi:hypothetical protein [Haliangium ochraceum]|uniref:Uncharacterized protein n=1 Tax=Haliangium ochraceum (strain DSM 14365 / JCM 11303 / SMP-2) TaxID=502025 RepID=D0LYJ1_HALO1|nr:hypothetical protein [Haliangium ochraceum]ACY17857.1 hypothetical protein Hoch_5373 [Haliangium ochraceum DSM 14365]